METKNKAHKLIKSLKRRKHITHLDIMLDGEDKDWFYYYQITGYYKNEYFSIDVRRNKLNNYPIVKIIETTDCKNEIKKLLKEFDLM